MDSDVQKIKADKLTKRFALLLEQTAKKGLSDKLIRKTFAEAKVINREKKINARARCGRRSTCILFGVILGVISVIFPLYGVTRHVIMDYIEETRCLIDNDGIFMEIARPLTSCEMCSELREIPLEENISQKHFLEKYAYSGVPVLIKKSTNDWTAMTEFSFSFFKNLYESQHGALDIIDEECQFFPYKTEFTTLAQVFNMSKERANFEEGEEPWYVGWSNCHPDIAVKLRKHYKRPYFLPPDSETSIIDWIFMGGYGVGAFIHLDYVQKPSWQAQISGSKTWQIIPPPECEHVCHTMNVTVEKGDIIVLDTNQWYHSTYIHPGEVSITIGSEYD